MGTRALLSRLDERVKAVKCTPAGCGLACGSAHYDHTPSLVVREWADGMVLLRRVRGARRGQSGRRAAWTRAVSVSAILRGSLHTRNHRVRYPVVDRGERDEMIGSVTERNCEAPIVPVLPSGGFASPILAYEAATQRDKPHVKRRPMMAISAMRIVWEHFTRGGSEMLVALALADWCDDDGRSLFPSMAAISKKCRISRSQAQRIMHRFIHEGLLEVVANGAGGKPGETPHYWLHLDRLTGSAYATGSTAATGSTDARDGLHGCHGRGRTGATQSTIYPSLTTINGADASSRRLAPCPAQKLIDLYHKAMPDNPRVKVLNKARERAIAARWREAAYLACSPFNGGYASEEDGLAKWEEFFRVCATSPFLTGQTPPQPGRPPFFADIDFLMSPSGFAKTLENRYHREAS